MSKKQPSRYKVYVNIPVYEMLFTTVTLEGRSQIIPTVNVCYERSAEKDKAVAILKAVNNSPHWSHKILSDDDGFAVVLHCYQLPDDTVKEVTYDKLDALGDNQELVLVFEGGDFDKQTMIHLHTLIKESNSLILQIVDNVDDVPNTPVRAHLLVPTKPQ